MSTAVSYAADSRSSLILAVVVFHLGPERSYLEFSLSFL